MEWIKKKGKGWPKITIVKVVKNGILIYVVNYQPWLVSWKSLNNSKVLGLKISCCLIVTKIFFW